MPEMVEIFSKVRGVTHEDPISRKSRQELIRRYVRQGTHLIARLDPENPVDENAIELWLPWKRKQFSLGYVNPDLVPRLAKVLRAGVPLTVTVKGVTGGTRGRETRGVNITIAYPKRVQRLAEEALPEPVIEYVAESDIEPEPVGETPRQTVATGRACLLIVAGIIAAVVILGIIAAALGG